MKENSIKVMSILGSPKNFGNTAAALSVLEKQLKKRDAKINRVHVAKLAIGGCRGCFVCQRNQDQLACAQQDDMTRLYDQMLESDVLVYASPIYAWHVSAQMKLFMDRQFCLIKGYGSANKSLVKDRKAALLVTSGGPSESNADLAAEYFNRMTTLMQLDSFGTTSIPNCQSPDSTQTAASDKMKQLAEALGDYPSA